MRPHTKSPLIDVALYDAPELYAAVFGDVAEDERALFKALLGAPQPGARVLSLGCGAGRIEAALARDGYRFAGIDAGPRMLVAARRNDPEGWYLAARMESLPFAGAQFAGAIAALLSFSYVGDGRARCGLLLDLARLLAPGAPLVIEVPVARHPRRLQGIREHYATDEYSYSFHYFDVGDVDETGAMLHSEFSVEANGLRASRNAAMMVFSPEGLARLFERTGFEPPRFYAPYALETGTDLPPEDCLRAVVATRTKKQG